MSRLMLALFSLVVFPCSTHGMTITQSDLAPSASDLLLGFDTSATASRNYYTMDRGGGFETAYGQTFQLDTNVLLDKITFKVRTSQNVDGKPLLFWFGTGYTGQQNSGLSSLMLTSEAELPSGMGASGDVSYVTLDIEDQSLAAGQTYAFMPRFASGTSGTAHAEMEVGFMGAYSYDQGAAYTFAIPFGYQTVLNNELVFFLHGTVVPEPGTQATLVIGLLLTCTCCQRRHH